MANTNKNNSSFDFKPWSMWLIIAMFVVLQLFIRSITDILEKDMSVYFQITAQEYGLSRSVYSLSYGLMQIPLGILLDRFGPKYISLATLCLFIAGIFVWIFAPNWKMVCVAQMMIGVGSSGAFITTCKVIKNWFDDKYFALMVGMTITLGMFGMIAGKILTSYLLLNGDALLPFAVFENTWRNILLHYAIFGSVLLLLVMLFINNNKNLSLHNQEDSWNLDAFKNIILSPKIIIIALLGALLVGPFEIFTSFAQAIFTTLYEVDAITAASLVSLLFLGFAVFNPVLAFLGEKSCNYFMTIICAIIMFITTYICVYSILPFESYGFKFNIFLLGIGSGYQVLIFNIAAKTVPKTYSATAISIAQCANMAIGSAIYPTVFGYMLNKSYFIRNGHALIISQNHNYANTDYIYAFKALFVSYIIAIIGFSILNYHKNKSK